jgi:probable rRNA maturation factor
MNLTLDIDDASGAADVPKPALLKRWIGAALAGHGKDAELCLRIVDANEITELNRLYRGGNYATNVLSFPAHLPEELQLPHLGDIVVCAEVVAREAREQHKSLEAHWAHMLVHGTLHLLGHDHIDDAEAEAMEALERTILAGLGYPDPYRSAEDVTQHHG